LGTPAFDFEAYRAQERLARKTPSIPAALHWLSRINEPARINWLEPFSRELSSDITAMRVTAKEPEGLEAQ